MGVYGRSNVDTRVLKDSVSFLGSEVRLFVLRTTFTLLPFFSQYLGIVLERHKVLGKILEACGDT